MQIAPVETPPVGYPAAKQSTSNEAASTSILIVDDDETIRLALAKFLRSRNYVVDTADGATAALELLGRNRYSVMFCDVRMPGMSGIELVPHALKLDETLAVMMLTAVNDAPTAARVLSSGAIDYLVKPIELADFHRAVERAIYKRELLMAQRLVEWRIRDEVESRTAELEQEKQALRGLTVSVAETLINAMEAKDIYLRGHSHRTAELAASIANVMNLDEDTIEAIRLAGRLHDIGEIGIRESVLHKPGKLEPEEYEHVKAHVRIGMEILAPLKHLGPVLTYIQDHHERMDGTGYPRGLSGEAISVGGRILAAVDAYDALTSVRPYRAPRTPAETLDYLKGTVGSLLDPAVYAGMLTVVKRRKSLIFIDDIPS